MRLTDRKALVVGGNRGIGGGISMGLAREGADVALTYAHHADEAAKVANEIRALGRKAVTVQMDLGNPGQIRRVVAEIIAEMGHLDILVNNGAIQTLRKPFHEATEGEFNEMVDINLKGVFICTQAVARHMVTRRSGRIVNMSSGIFVRAAPRMGIYAATKGGLNSFTKGMAHDLAPYGINVNAIAPGLIQTPGSSATFADSAALENRIKRIPMRRVGQPEDLAGLVAFLCSDEAAYMTGTTIFIDGGSTMGN